MFLDKDCLQDGQSWLAGFIQGMVASMVVMPLLSWTDDDRGSLGELSRIGVNGFDRVDNVLNPQPDTLNPDTLNPKPQTPKPKTQTLDQVLLELMLALTLRDEPAAATQVACLADYS